MMIETKMKMNHLFKILMLYVILAFQKSDATVWYIATDGTAMNNGTDISSPGIWDDVRAKMVCGDTVYIRGGTYKVNSYYNVNFSTPYCDLPTTMKNYNNEKVIFDAFVTFPSEYWIPTSYPQKNGLYILNATFTADPRFGVYYDYNKLVIRFNLSDVERNFVDNLFFDYNHSSTYTISIPQDIFYKNGSSFYVWSNISASLYPWNISFLTPFNFWIHVPNFTLSGIEFRGCNEVCVSLLGSNSTVTNCTFDSVFSGVQMFNYSKVHNNTFIFRGKNELADRINITDKPEEGTRWERLFGVTSQYLQSFMSESIYFIECPVSTSWQNFDVGNEISYNYFDSTLVGVCLLGGKDTSVHHNIFYDTFQDTIGLYPCNPPSLSTQIYPTNIHIYKNLFLDSNAAIISAYAYSTNVTISRNVYYVKQKIPYNDKYNLWTYLYTEHDTSINLYHNLFASSFLSTRLTGLTNNNNNNITYINNIISNASIDPLLGLTYQNNFISSFLVDSEHGIFNYSINYNNTVNSTVDVVFRDGTLDLLEPLKSMVVDGGETIPNYVDTTRTIGLPDIGPFESYEILTPSWPFQAPLRDCVYTEWTSWSCDCQSSTQTRTRSLIIFPSDTIACETLQSSPCACTAAPSTGVPISVPVSATNTTESVIVNDGSNYIDNSTTIENTRITLSNSSQFISSASDIRNTNINLSTNTTLLSGATSVIGSNISATDSTIVYQNTSVVISHTTINLSGSNLTTLGNFTIDSSSVLNVDSKSLIKVKGCANINTKITISSSSSSLSSTRISSPINLIQASCFQQDTVTIVDSSTGASCDTKFKNRGFGIYVLSFDQSSTTSSSVCGGGQVPSESSIQIQAKSVVVFSFVILVMSLIIF
eukprot:TRINITY_DN7742_c0_g1_i1.p1 TRINITY_DN7742_c0_g1~~TRINITY_DN7742_c0_g1_i1.p1  ORF type:complete len:876 (-),score=120.80 TRINITY_DN7742_c0_g1_i1:64-2691(-)